MADATSEGSNPAALAALEAVFEQGRQQGLKEGILRGLEMAEELLGQTGSALRAKRIMLSNQAAPDTQDTGAAESLKHDLSQSIEVLGLNPRALSQLSRNEILTIGELVAMSEDDLRGFGRFGPVTIDNIKTQLRGMGLSLKGDTPA